jgi:hypothetical protein
VLAGEHALCDGYNQTPFPPHSAYHLGIVPPNAIELMHPPPVNLPVPKAFLLGGCPNYSHWLMDYLPRLALWSGDLPLLVNDGLRPLQLESLAALGIGEDKLMRLPYPGAYCVALLHYPSLNSAWCTPPLPFRPEIVVEWLRARFAPLFSSARERRRLFITRADARNAAVRRLLNSDEIERVAQRHGFEIIAPETLSFAEQVTLFSQAAVIAGPHGAGFANMAFAPAGTRIVELIGPRGGREAGGAPAVYRTLATAMRFDFSRCIGASDERLRIESGHLPLESFTIDPASFSAALERLP